MNRIIIVSAFLVAAIIRSSSAQSNALNEADKKTVLQELGNSLAHLDTSHYRADMHFKEFGGDTFEIRKFIINYRSNPNNPLYGYDYEIAELGNQGIFTIMTLDHSLFIIINENKFISEQKLPDQIDMGSYFENIRSSFIIEDVYLPFLNVPSNEVTIIDSNNCYYLHREMNDLAVRILEVNKHTLLPKMWSSIISNRDFDLKQTKEVYFHFDPNISALPTTAFSIEQYLSDGYEHIVSKPDTSIKSPFDKTIALEQQNLLLHYPFILPEGDTIIIQDNNAKYILLDFWYASCFPCLKAMPELNHLAELYSEADLDILAINCFDLGIKNNLALRMREKNIRIPLLFGSNDLIKSLSLSSFPTYYLITPDRKVEVISGGIEGVRITLDSLFKRD